jgi:alkylhydroperoxidase/carboxymuconolactone decarboxylase family protein YurZ
MSRSKPIEYAEASPEVRAVFDDIRARRKIEDVNNFWKYLVSDPALLKRTWETQRQVLAPGSLDLLTKELIYLAVSVTNGCSYPVQGLLLARKNTPVTISHHRSGRFLPGRKGEEIPQDSLSGVG